MGHFGGIVKKMLIFYNPQKIIKKSLSHQKIPINDFEGIF
jgi:hypothetical protein